MHKPCLAVLALLAASGAGALAGQIRYLPDAPGRWKPWRFEAYADNRRVSAAKATEVKALEAQLLALNAILRQAPGFAAPMGFSVETVGSLDVESHGPGQPVAAALPLPGTLNFGAYAVHEWDADGKTKRDDTGETAQVLFFVNQLALPILFEGNGVSEFDHLETDVTLLARPEAAVYGMPRHGSALVIKKNPAPLSVPVSLGESLQLLSKAVSAPLVTSREAVARVQKQYDDATDPAKRAQRIAEFKRLAPMVKDPAYVDKMIKADRQIEAGLAKMIGPASETTKAMVAVERELAAVTAALDALSAADRAAPACYVAGNIAGPARFTRDLAAACAPVVRPNWKLFNPALPRSAPQLLVIGHFDRCLESRQPAAHQGGCTANRRLLEGLDQRAVLAWLQ
jgi:hypothetical protein